MDTTLSPSSVSSLALRLPSSSSRHQHHLHLHHHPLQPPPTSTTRSRTRAASRSATATISHPHLSFTSSSCFYRNHSLTHTPSSPNNYDDTVVVMHSRKAATGYATALIDVLQARAQLHQVHQDVRRLSKLLRSPQLQQLSEEHPLARREILNELVLSEGEGEGGRVHRSLVALWKLLLSKEAVADVVMLMREVLDEFIRIYGEMRSGLLEMK